MWFDEAGEVLDMFKNSFPYSFLFFVPIFIIISPAPAAAAHEFAVYRMQQYDLQGSSYGCPNALVNVEARSIDATMYTRRCVVAKLRELTLERYKDIVSQTAGALLVLLPQDLHKLSKEDKDHLLELEQDMLQEESSVPVFFTPETDDLRQIHEDVQSASNSDSAGSAAEAMLGSASASGFQMVVTGSQAKALSDFQVINLQGKLTGQGIEEQLPTVAIVAHYDAYGAAPSLAKGADSNGSGVAALLEMARLFSKLYKNSRTHAKFNVIFLLSGAGKFNYQGTKRWIEDQMESGDNPLLNDVAYVLCLDAIGTSNNLHLHVSKPPKEGSPGDVLVKKLEEIVSSIFKDITFELVHKKINLAEEFLAWEHERFSIRRLPAFTLSNLPSHKALIRNSILDVRENVDTSVLARNVHVLAEALARHLFNITSDVGSNIFANGLKVEEGMIQAWLDYLAGSPRSAQLLTKDSPVVSTLEQTLTRYLKDVRRIVVKADKRDPDFVFYDGVEYTMNAYSVKPAIFDLFLAVGIAAYLAFIWLTVQHFGSLYRFCGSLLGPVKMKQHTH